MIDFDDEPDQEKRIEKLRSQLEQFGGDVSDNSGLSADLEEEFLKHILAFETAEPTSLLQWLKNAGLTPEPDKATAQEHVPLDLKEREALFREFADYQGTPEAAKAAAHLDPKRREALFRDFAEYQKTHRVIVAYHDHDTAPDH